MTELTQLVQLFQRQMEAQQRQIEAQQRQMEAQMEVQQRQMEAQQRQMEAQQRQIEVQQRQMEAQLRQMEGQLRQMEAQQRQMEAQQRQMQAQLRQMEAHQRQMESQQKQMEDLIDRLAPFPGSSAPHLSAASIPKFIPFDPTSELWKDYLARFHTFASANSVPKEKLALIFLTNQTTATHKLLSTLASQQTPTKVTNELTMKDITTFRHSMTPDNLWSENAINSCLAPHESQERPYQN